MSGPPEDAADVVDDSALHVPVPALRPYVASWTGYRQAGVPPGLHRGLPSPFLTVIFTLDDPLVIAAHPDPAQGSGTFETLVGGLHTSPALISHDGRQSGIQLALTPLGARTLLRMPAGELAGIDVHGDDVLGRLAAGTQDRLRELSDWPSRFAFLEHLLLTELWDADGSPGLSPEISYAWRHLLRTGGTAPMTELVTETGWSDRYLRHKFRLETGLGPKEAARVIRFDQTRRRLQQRHAAGEQLALAELAATAGYFDQAHMDREFRMLAGCPPTTWLATEFRNVQATAVSLPPG